MKLLSSCLLKNKNNLQTIYATKLQPWRECKYIIMLGSNAIEMNEALH